MAPRGKVTQLNNMYVADFETCDSPYTPQGRLYPNQRVWLAGVKNLETLETLSFCSLESFMEHILARGDNTNTEYGFHNLKYDGSYIVPYLLKNGWMVGEGKPQPQQFSILVDERNAWYSITIQVTKRRKVTIWDTLKLFPTSLEYVPDIYATPTHKIIEDSSFYDDVRDEGHTPTERELDYFENDLQVLAEALRSHIDLYGLRFKKTQASQSFKNFEDSFKAWKWRFPPLSTKVDSEIRPAYWGGISYVPSQYAGTDFTDINVWDINSSYPHKAAYCKLPYGNMLYEWGKGEAPDMSKFWVGEVICSFTLKKDHLPCIPMKAVTEGRPVELGQEKWLTKSPGIVKIALCSIDYLTIHQSYDFEVIEWCWTKHWAQRVHKEVKNFVETNNKIKVENRILAKTETDPQRKIELETLGNRAKIDNNSFYGKFGEEIIKRGKTPHLNGEDIDWEVDREDEQGERARKFLPVAIAITAYGRRQLVEFANLLGEHFLYCDTDSVHYLDEAQPLVDEAIQKGTIEVDDTRLGAWSFEGHFVWGRYLRAKAYMEEKADGTMEVTLAGLPADKHTGQFSKTRSVITKENFKIGTVIEETKSGRLTTHRTQTGNKLVPASFTIKEKETSFGL